MAPGSVLQVGFSGSERLKRTCVRGVGLGSPPCRGLGGPALGQEELGVTPRTDPQTPGSSAAPTAVLRPPPRATDPSACVPVRFSSSERVSPLVHRCLSSLSRSLQEGEQGWTRAFHSRVGGRGLLVFKLPQGRLLGCGGEFVEKRCLPHRRLLEMPGDTVMARGPGPPCRARSCGRRRT